MIDYDDVKQDAIKWLNSLDIEDGFCYCTGQGRWQSPNYFFNLIYDDNRHTFDLSFHNKELDREEDLGEARFDDTKQELIESLTNDIGKKAETKLANLLKRWKRM